MLKKHFIKGANHALAEARINDLVHQQRHDFLRMKNPEKDHRLQHHAFAQNQKAIVVDLATKSLTGRETMLLPKDRVSQNRHQAQAEVLEAVIHLLSVLAFQNLPALEEASEEVMIRNHT